MVAVEYNSLGEHGISLQIAYQTLVQIPAGNLESVAPKQVFIAVML